MNNGYRQRALLTESKNMRHDVMAHIFFDLGSNIKIDIGAIFFHLPDLFVGDRETQFFFGPSQCYPKTAPGGELFLG
ncbi:hypothetical protein SDC9_191185 [bioreactor metagenome]|uniref:Uncharacterized protein n=1 Tax=bioreactor metagenome TaxID=1076179 RepID=A0A645HX71_9ZZZZ